MSMRRMNYQKEGVRVGPSAYGLGVFSLHPFHGQQLIGRVRGEVHADPTYESEYCIEFGQQLALEPSPPFRYLNHSCQPNCALVEVEVQSPRPAGPRTEIWLEALVEIGTDEQMTIDYAWPASGAIPCHCGAANCRGWIVASDERDLVDPARRLSPGA
jgi:hypothetical protein